MKTAIVAEVSKNWRNGVEALSGSGPLSEQFEQVVNFNISRGYRLLSFHVNRMMVSPDEMNETLIAVFVKAKRARNHSPRTRRKMEETWTSELMAG